MVDQSIAHRSFVDVTRLRVGDPERVISAMLVRSTRKVAMQSEDIIHQLVLEFLHVLLLSFASQEFLPRGEQILDGNDILVAMSESTPASLNPPPTFAAAFGADQKRLHPVA
jgi:hypothetical protein